MSKVGMIAFRCILIALALVIAGGAIYVMWDLGVFITDDSAAVYVEFMEWNGKRYVEISGRYSEGRAIAKTKDGNAKINEVEEDPSHTFVVVRSFLDDQLYVLKSYHIPQSGELTTVCWDRTYITDAAFLDALSKIDAEKTTSFTYETDSIYASRDDQRMKVLYFAYENCPVTTVYKGLMGKVNGEWVITTEIFYDQPDEYVMPESYQVGCYRIPREYWDILDKYFR
ncbi:MAG: hypothetical protein E7448_05555 [Ruminococcaceae bacterium]|nr:hypothetical protein [Oscillospiraceae bacterium]